jgi:hypothetical protein
LNQARKAQQKTSQPISDCDVTRNVSKPRMTLREGKAPPRGVEPQQEGSGKTRPLGARGAKSGAVSAQPAPIPPDLQVIIDAWPGLPESVRAKIAATVAATREGTAD